MKYLFTFLLIIGIYHLQAQTGIDVPSMHGADQAITNFMSTWNIPGGEVAITKDGRLIYNKAFGYADQAKTIPTQPYNIFRIASDSKPITSIAIMTLIQNGQLHITDTVFGVNRVLNQPYYLNGITDARIYNITIQQLLEHNAGWDRDIPCYGYTGCDPIAFPLHVTSVLGEPNPVGDSALIKFLLVKGLNHDPGTTYAYSNIGYLILGKVIEKITGMKYDDYVKSIILDPVGDCDTHLGKNLLVNKQEREVEYTNPYTTLSCYGDGTTVPWQYGGWNLEAMNAHGGWITTCEDYVRIILSVDNFNTFPDILNSNTIALMTTPSVPYANYAKGWSVNQYNNWWHQGSLDGASSNIVRTSDGYTWAYFFNARNLDNNYSTALDQLAWDALNACTSFPFFNLFAPSTNISGIAIAKTSPTSVHLSWTNGNGDGRIILASSANVIAAYPNDGATYTANGTYGSGQNLGGNVYAVYSGSGNSADITGLDANTTYNFTGYEYFNNASTGNNAVYKLGCHKVDTINMHTEAINNIALQDNVIVYPNPAKDFLTVQFNGNKPVDVIISDATGKEIKTTQLNTTAQINITSLPAGLYTLKTISGAEVGLHKFVKI